MKSNNYLLISLLCITSMWITSCFSPGNSSENNTQSANNNSTRDLTIGTGDSKIKFKNKVLTISDISKQDHCFFGIAGTVISDHAETGGGKLKNIYTGTTTSYPIYYKCKITSRIIPIPKSDKPVIDSMPLDYFDAVDSENKYASFTTYHKTSSPDKIVKVIFNEGLSTYVYAVTPPKHYKTSHANKDILTPFTAIPGTKFYTTKPFHEEYPPLNSQFIKDESEKWPGTKVFFVYGRLGKVVDAGLPPFERFTDFEIGNLPEDTNNHYATDGVAPITFNVDNIKGIYAGSEYDLDDIDKQNLNISFKVEFDQDTTPMCQPDAIVKTIHDSINPGHYSLQFDLLKMHENGCFESNTTLNNYQIVASINGIRYIYPFSLFESEKFKITDVSLVDFTNTELTELHIPEAGAYKYYINQIKVTTDFFGENGLQSYIVPITPAMIGVWTYGGFRLDKVSLSVKDSRVKVGQDQSGYYLQVPDKPGDFDTTLTINTTWTDLETNLPVTLSSNDHPITVYADYGQLAFDDVRFEYYNYKKDLVDLRDLDDKKGPLYIWESGNPVFVKVTGVLFDHKDSTRIDITGLIDPINWSLNDHDSIGKCLGTEKNPNPESWHAVTTLSWSNKDNAMVQAGIGSGQDCVSTEIEKDDGAVEYLMNSQHGVASEIKNFIINTSHDVLNHIDLSDPQQFNFSFDLIFNVGDKTRGESTITCHGTSFNDCGGVTMYYSKNPNYLGTNTRLMDNIIPDYDKYYLYLKSADGHSQPSENIVEMHGNKNYNKAWNMAGPYDQIGGNNTPASPNDFDIKLIPPTCLVDYWWNQNTPNFNKVINNEVGNYWFSSPHGCASTRCKSALADVSNDFTLFGVPNFTSTKITWGTMYLVGSQYKNYIAYPLSNTYNFNHTNVPINRADPHTYFYNIVNNMLLFSTLPTKRAVTLKFGYDPQTNQIIASDGSYSVNPLALAAKPSFNEYTISFYLKDGVVFCKDANGTATYSPNQCTVNNKRAIVNTQMVDNGKTTILIDMSTEVLFEEGEQDHLK